MHAPSVRLQASHSPGTQGSRQGACACIRKGDSTDVFIPAQDLRNFRGNLQTLQCASSQCKCGHAGPCQCRCAASKEGEEGKRHTVQGVCEPILILDAVPAAKGQLVPYASMCSWLCSTCANGGFNNSDSVSLSAGCPAHQVCPSAAHVPDRTVHLVPADPPPPGTYYEPHMAHGQ